VGLNKNAKRGRRGSIRLTLFFFGSRQGTGDSKNGTPHVLP
jgi:hypothetical protein